MTLNGWKEMRGDLPRKTGNSLTDIGGALTPLGATEFLSKQREIRKRILQEVPRYRDISETVFSSDYCGTVTKPVVNRPVNHNRKGKKMPKVTSNTVSVENVAGKRGRKSEFDYNDFALAIGKNFDVTEEMCSGISEDISGAEGFNLEAFLAEMWNMETRDDSVSAHRKNRFSALKRAAVKKNGEKSRYSLGIGSENGKPVAWIMTRDKDAK